MINVEMIAEAIEEIRNNAPSKQAFINLTDWEGSVLYRCSMNANPHRVATEAAKVINLNQFEEIFTVINPSNGECAVRLEEAF